MGAGILGLSCAWKLSEDPRYTIHILSDTFTPSTTSDGAGGLWEPYEAQPQELISRWSQETKIFLDKLEKEGWPVFSAKSEKVVQPGEDYEPYWKGMVRDWRKSEKTINGCGIISWTTPIVKTPQFMANLMALLSQRGVNFINYKVKTIQGLLRLFPFKMDMLVNCIGLSNREVLKDPLVYPIRGVLVILKPQPQLGYYAIDAPETTYVISRDDLCVLGGTTDKGVEEDPAREELEEIIRRCVRWVPELLVNGSIESQMKGFWVGLRPGRQEARLELDVTHPVPIVHCYGHGGSGWTTFWGCALDVNNIINKHLTKSKI
uniref:FAD dependent oxidoreductase domain-containing protein n=1 Tax=Arcella intermedia TaxID=1963864 RepID=A0A6B2LA56_9EUKA